MNCSGYYSSTRKYDCDLMNRKHINGFNRKMKKKNWSNFFVYQFNTKSLQMNQILKAMPLRKM